MQNRLQTSSVHWSYLRLEEELDLFRGQMGKVPEIQDHHIARILLHIHRDPFTVELNVSQVRRCCRIRDNNISSRFRYLLGKTIRTYIEDLRLKAACHLLQASPTGIFDIALAVGYAHPQTFYNAFRRHFRCTPAEYRTASSGPGGPEPESPSSAQKY